jgi:hypothetical protein
VSTSTLQVVNRTTLGYATVPNTGEKRWAIYDPTRTAVYAVNVTQNTLVRYQLSGGAWHVDQLPIASIGDLAFAPDRKSLIVGSGVSELYAVDPDTLTPQLLASYTLGGFAPAYGIAPSLLSTKGMVITNDARLWIQSVGLYFDISTKTFNSLPVSSPNVRAGFGAPSYYASADGSTMLEVSNGSYPEPPVVRYSAATGKEVLANLPNSSIFLLSQDGSKVLDEYGSLYRVSDQTVLGKVNLSLSGRVAVLSPDGNRAYTLVAISLTNPYLVFDHVDVFDTTQVVPGTTDFVKVGQIPLTDQSLFCGPNAPYGCDYFGALLISPLGDTLFWVGNQQLVVTPIPSPMASVASVRMRLLPATTH